MPDGAGRARCASPFARAKQASSPGPRIETFRPFVKRHFPDLCELAADDRLGRLVVEHKRPLIVGDQRWRGEVGRELAGEDENQVLVSPLLH